MSYPGSNFGLRDRNSPMCTLSQNGYGAGHPHEKHLGASGFDDFLECFPCNAKHCQPTIAEAFAQHGCSPLRFGAGSKNIWGRRKGPTHTPSEVAFSPHKIAISEKALQLLPPLSGSCWARQNCIFGIFERLVEVKRLCFFEI